MRSAPFGVPPHVWGAIYKPGDRDSDFMTLDVVPRDLESPFRPWQHSKTPVLSALGVAPPQEPLPEENAAPAAPVLPLPEVRTAPAQEPLQEAPVPPQVPLLEAPAAPQAASARARVLAAAKPPRAPRSSLHLFVEGSAEPLRMCHTHGKYMKLERFHGSSVKKGVYECKECVCKNRNEWSRRNRDKLCAAEIRKREKVEFSAADYNTVISKFGDKCFITKKKATGEKKASGADAAPPTLTLIRADRSKPFGVDNCAPACRRIARKAGWTLPPHLRAAWREIAARGEAPPAFSEVTPVSVTDVEEPAPADRKADVEVVEAVIPPPNLAVDGEAPRELTKVAPHPQALVTKDRAVFRRPVATTTPFEEQLALGRVFLKKRKLCTREKNQSAKVM